MYPLCAPRNLRGPVEDSKNKQLGPKKHQDGDLLLGRYSDYVASNWGIKLAQFWCCRQDLGSMLVVTFAAKKIAPTKPRINQNPPRMDTLAYSFNRQAGVSLPTYYGV